MMTFDDCLSPHQIGCFWGPLMAPSPLREILSNAAAATALLLIDTSWRRVLGIFFFAPHGVIHVRSKLVDCSTRFHA